ncbi:hypothetical protein B0A62_13770 [Flavobacterium hydatis]|uniref:Uncharacterized protein n=2 Tax=Flavobacterium hydatis TaxID=991 RepID=A0A086A043_FLAHY|nr:hypothetical protein IW20_21520 [Flavobacterium hydatis]OXA93310.1 hypothetical protein B0A62_13770 [Flavobacterium hydatis]
MFSIIVFSLLIACKKEIKEIRKTEETEAAKNKYKITLVFPDTVYVNESYNGRIDYENYLDTITTSLEDVEKARFLEYAFLITKDKSYGDDYLNKVAKDTFVAESNRMIPLYNIKFDKLGLNYFDGFITDEVMIENGAKNDKGESMTRIITDKFRLTRGVYVIERNNRADNKKHGTNF